jgi:hypothetical protein
MRNFLKLFLFVALIMIAGCAGSSLYMRKSTPIEEISSGKVRVYFMRPSGLGFAIHFQIWDRYRLIGLSQAKSYFAYECEPGEHLFIGRAENKRAVEADLEAGKSYYIITQVKMGAWKARMAFIPVTKGSEFWDKVEQYKKELNFVEPEKEVIAKWESEKKDEIQKEISEIISYIQTPEGKKYVLPLTKEDGR